MYLVRYGVRTQTWKAGPRKYCYTVKKMPDDDRNDIDEVRELEEGISSASLKLYDFTKLIHG